MSLAVKLEKIREGAKERIPEETRILMQQATAELRDSGIMTSACKAGDPLPPFELVNVSGQRISSKELLAKGNLILTFYRGVW